MTTNTSIKQFRLVRHLASIVTLNDVGAQLLDEMNIKQSLHVLRDCYHELRKNLLMAQQRPSSNQASRNGNSRPQQQQQRGRMETLTADAAQTLRDSIVQQLRSRQEVGRACQGIMDGESGGMLGLHSKSFFVYNRTFTVSALLLELLDSGSDSKNQQGGGGSFPSLPTIHRLLSAAVMYNLALLFHFQGILGDRKYYEKAKAMYLSVLKLLLTNDNSSSSQDTQAVAASTSSSCLTTSTDKKTVIFAWSDLLRIASMNNLLHISYDNGIEQCDEAERFLVVTLRANLQRHCSSSTGTPQYSAGRVANEAPTTTSGTTTGSDATRPASTNAVPSTTSSGVVRDTNYEERALVPNSTGIITTSAVVRTRRGLSETERSQLMKNISKMSKWGTVAPTSHAAPAA